MKFDVKSIICIFTIIDSNINLLTKNNDLIYVNCDDDLDLVNSKYIKENINTNNLSLKQCYTFSNKKDKKIELNVLYMDIINIEDIKLNNDFNFIELNNLDKNNVYINKSIEFLKKELTLNTTIKKIYPGEFSLPEIQKIYENLLNIKYDRRNFRKKLIKQDVIEPLNKMSSGKAGRPASLYRFKDTTIEKTLV